MRSKLKSILEVDVRTEGHDMLEREEADSCCIFYLDLETGRRGQL